MRVCNWCNESWISISWSDASLSWKLPCELTLNETARPLGGLFNCCYVKFRSMGSREWRVRVCVSRLSVRLRRAVIIGRVRARSVGCVFFKVSRKPLARWVGRRAEKSIRTKVRVSAVSPSFSFFAFLVLFLLAIWFIHGARCAGPWHVVN